MRSVRLLVIDDEESIGFAIQRFFQARGLRVDCAQELAEAQALLATRRYAVAIVDLRLTSVHGAEGLEALSYIREQSPWTRSILLTAYGSNELEVEALRCGADMVLRKPQALPELAACVLRLTEEEE